jgi:hypothetical protein
VTKAPDCPKIEFDASYTFMAKKWTGKFWYVLLLHAGRAQFEESAIIRHVDDDWELFEKGTLHEMRAMFDRMPDPELEAKLTEDLYAELTEIDQRDPNPHRNLPNFGRF